jgi:DNA modification methylase
MVMRIETLKLSEIRPNDWNPNEMSEEIFQSLVRSVSKYGVLQPILLRSDMSIIKGEKRWKAAKAVGIEELVCIVIETSDEESKLLNISLEHLRGASNEELLASLISELSNHFSLDDLQQLTGYSSEELDQMVADLPDDEYLQELDTPIEEDDFDVEKAASEIQDPVTKRGEVWQLGRHVLMCGDSTSSDDVQRLMNDRKADLVVTDPPYNVAVKSDSTRLVAEGRGMIMNDDMDDRQFDEFLEAVFKNYAAIMDDKAAIYVFHASSYQRAFENAMNIHRINVRTQCIWVKNAASFGFAQYKFKHEPVFYAHLKGKVPSWYGDYKQTTVWKSGLSVMEHEPDTVWEVSRGDVSKYIHPTQKPLELIAIPIRNSSKKGDLVVDLFGGSGATLMTCEKMERTCYTMELDPIFCDVIKKRFFEATGIEPVLLQQK